MKIIKDHENQQYWKFQQIWALNLMFFVTFNIIGFHGL
jgi:predicted negative regulator of RcsB-dependent stress response